MLTLVAAIPSAPEMPSAPPGYTLRPCRPSDIPDLGQLYFESYYPGVASVDLSEAVADIGAAFGGAYGELWPEASLVAIAGGKQLAAAIQVVRQAPWEDTPAWPFIIELFTSRSHRGRGGVRALVRGVMAVVAGANHEHPALRVAEDNAPALSLYRSLGFHQWTPRPDLASV